MYHELTDHFIVSSDLDTTWRFFSQAMNLPAITPPWLKFRIRSDASAEIQKDSLLEYTISWMGIPVRWRTRIIDWNPQRQFIDLQIRGPYTLWHHQHTFTPVSEGVECTDRVIYKLPGPIIGRMAHAIIVRRQLLEIFQYRRKVIGERLGWARAVQEDIEIRNI